MATITPLSLCASIHLSSSSRNPIFHAIFHRPGVNFSLGRKLSPSLSLRNPNVIRMNQFTALSSSSSRSLPLSTKSAVRSSLLTGPTRSLASLAALSLVVIRVLAYKLSLAIQNPNPHFVDAVRFSLRNVGPAFFASMRDRPAGYLNTPLTVVAMGLKKWLDIYSGVLMVRVLLSWFPNIPWERQPMSAIRDLCDPYLNLFRNIIPPVFDTLDVSPLLAFAVLGTLGSIVSDSTGM